MRKTSLPFPAEETEEILHDSCLCAGDCVHLFVKASEPLRIMVFRVRDRYPESVIKEIPCDD